MQNDAVSKYRDLIKQSDLKADFFEIEIFSAVRANLGHELSMTLLIDIGASKTKITLVEFGIIRAFHIISRGGADISDAISKSLTIPFSDAEKMKKEFGLFGNPNEKSMADIIRLHVDYIFSETNNVIIGYEKKYNKTVSKIILTGGGALIKGIHEVATSSFKAEIEIGKPFSKVGAPEFLEKVLGATGPEFATALGIALRKLQ
jgi:cell division ATPase FtsA